MTSPLKCPKCSQVLQDDGIPRKRRRARQCGKCRTKGILKRRRGDPCRLLQHRFQNSARKWWPGSRVKHLTSLSAVRAVVERCGRQCVLSEERNMDLLSIIPKRIQDAPPTSSDGLVLVSKRRARDLKEMSQADRSAILQNGRQQRENKVE